MEASEVIKQQKTEIYNLKAKIKELENKTSKPIAGDKVEQLVEALEIIISEGEYDFEDTRTHTPDYSRPYWLIKLKKALTSFTSQSGKEEPKEREWKKS